MAGTVLNEGLFIHYSVDEQYAHTNERHSDDLSSVGFKD